MTTDCPEGLALYLRRYSRGSHGTPAQHMKKHRDAGAKWIAIAGPWDDDDGGLRYINRPDTCKLLLDAAYSAGLQPFIWGYPWLGREEAFADAMDACAGQYNCALLDPELGSNPVRASSGPGKARADAGATKLVSLMAERFAGGVCGLSTFGSGVRFKWFPLNSFAAALAQHFPKRSFIGGQTYTDDSVIDRSIADFVGVINKTGGGLGNMKLVPNFGTYARTGDKASPYRAKTPVELDAHFMEFIDEREPVDAMIGWAENFMTPGLWKSFSKMAERMDRGATRL